ncbi:uncharacterized protein V1513DRAFT_435180 [Lipomyces chichibuensis]|uniref:uncharacterized protein n=1 Tax=Lipomyces chichibuensis TaxID=1546026 RepID=UPI00334366EA
MSLEKRQWYWSSSSTSWEIKWGVLGAILIGVMLTIAFAYAHARYRLSKGLEPLHYHAWLVQNRMDLMRRQRDAFIGNQTYREQYTTYPAYPMNTFYTNHTDLAPPPPAYDPRYPGPPQYIPPPDTKIDGASPAPTSPDTASGSTPPVGQTENPYLSGIGQQNPAANASAGTAYRYGL